MAKGRFIDLDLEFKPNPSTGDIIKKYDAAAIRRSVKNLILTKPGERPFTPNFGCTASNLLFEKMSVLNLNIIKTEIEMALNTYEPRITLNSVFLRPVPLNKLKVEITYTILNQSQPETINVLLEKIR